MMLFRLLTKWRKTIKRDLPSQLKAKERLLTSLILDFTSTTNKSDDKSLGASASSTNHLVSSSTRVNKTLLVQTLAIELK